MRAALESLGSAATTPRSAAPPGARTARPLTLYYLPERYGGPEWKYIQELSVDEIATRLQIGPKAAESLLTRARQAFRDAFATLHGGAEAWER